MKTCILFIALTMGFEIGTTGLVSAQQTIIDNDQSDLVIKQLWSSDEADRMAAKKKLLELGPRAIQPLLLLLEDIMNNPVPRYMTGKEKEAAEAQARYDRAVESRNEAELLASAEQISTLNIRSRLKRDAIDLLALLKAEEAVPLLIRSIYCCEVEVARPGKDPMRPEMEGLIKLGSVAIPKLLEAIQSAEDIARSFRYDSQKVTEEEVRWRTEYYKNVIQMRAVRVISEIGDDRALPVLEQLLNTIQDKSKISYVKEAITKIKHASK
jgi:hypothetical protein